MTRVKHVSKRKSRTKAIPVLGAAGLLSLAGGASTATGGPAANIPTPQIAPSHEITLGEEEISDVSLATFFVFDKENIAPRPDVLLVKGKGCGGKGCGGKGCGGKGCGGKGCGGKGCGGRGCGGGCGLGGCGCWGGCGCGCCLSWGGCRIC